MKTSTLFEKNKTVLSYEVFPPKPTSKVDTIYSTIEGLKEISPDFISVTYGAGGGKNNTETFRIASLIKSYGIESVVHLPCIAMSKEDVLEKIRGLKEIGVDNILALRGDVPADEYTPGDFKYASDLVAFIKEHGDFDIAAACYPEGHIECGNKVEDVKNLKRKVDAGVDHLITQLFLDNEYYYSFMERCDLAGINVPVEAGIMPVTNKKQIKRMATMCGVNIPKKYVDMMDRYEDNPLAIRDCGIAYAVDQIVDLIAHGVSGIHLYTMNNPYVAQRIHEAVHNLL